MSMIIHLRLPLVLFVVVACFTSVKAVHFCFLKQPSVPDEQPDFKAKQDQNGQNSAINSQLRSYHPHYLISLSYPHPMTPHIYYGQVINNNPLFLYSDIDRWHPNSIQKLTINGIQFTDASAKYFLLRRQQVFRYMLVIQMENSYLKHINYTMNVYERKDHFLVVCEYENTSKAFVIYLTEKQKIVQLENTAHPGVRINVRNESGPPQTNWRFSREVRWVGASRFRDPNVTNFRGFVLQIQYVDRNLLKSVKLNFKQAKYDLSQSVQQFLLQQSSLFTKTIPKTVKRVSKFGSCADTAYERLLDGLSYEYGSLRIRDGNMAIHNQPKQLLSFCPSGKRFPWGFLWDDGFHCQVAVRKDPLTVLKVIKSWLDTQLDSGWIPRQQNRGAERQLLCSCPRFMQKDVKDGNPPTLLLALDYLNKRNLLNIDSFEPNYWLKIKKWYEWFMKTQKDSEAMVFKWHDSLHQQGASFTSGMDDFPRPNVAKGHIDLQTWMYFFTKFLAQACHLYGQDPTVFIADLELIKNNFKFFINPSDNTYRDIAHDGNFSIHFGYPNILPVAFGIPVYLSLEYNATIEKVKKQLDIGVGLASISKMSPLFLANKDAYWRGPVWININYLFLRGLKLYYPKQQQLYTKLREEILVTVCSNWQKTGYFYQNYINGIGSFGYPFNGWTSLVAIIWDQNY